GVHRIAVVGGLQVRDACAHRVDRVIDESASGGENILRALHAWPDDDELIYATSDLPYVTAAAVGDFLDRVPDGAIAMSICEQAAFDQRFPDAPPFGITLGGERVVNGGIFSLPCGSCAPVGALATRFFAARKTPWRMAGLVSPLALVRLLTGRLRIAHVEAEAERALGVAARAVRGCAAELAFDADTVAEYRYACENP
ncbi:MAG: hypothetical protein JOZ01_08035, partial [Candidatus Eremiobacteraeota bacterium]|nr:hypothetical protein [Candidatus Eremiobacteraeota bacterium]